MAAEQLEKPRVFANVIVCESAIKDHTGVLTAIRITNSYALSPAKYTPPRTDGTFDEANAQYFYLPFAVALIITFYAEGQTEFDATLFVTPPDGKRRQMSPTPIRCRIAAAGAGHTLNVKFSLTTQIEGLFWIEVHVDGQLATKSPVVIKLNAPDADEQTEEEFEVVPTPAPHDPGRESEDES